MRTRITSLEFRNYKAFSRFSLNIQDVNLLVGPNNCGKSTIIGAFRALSAGLRLARSRNPERIVTENEIARGYRVPEDQLAISTENVHTDYSEQDSTITFRLNNGNRLRLVFPRERGCFLAFETGAPRFVGSPKSFKEEFPITVSVVPVLGPLEHEEEAVTQPTIQRNLHTSRASRHFRNYWYYYPDGFNEFADLVEQTWLGMEVEKPELLENNRLRMFCKEKRITRELYWSGFGFQVWTQLLTHISRAKEDTVFVIDEPEIYLHPDVQRQLLRIPRNLGPDIVVATHSTEMMSEADPSEIVLVDKCANRADRLRDIAGIQMALEQVGSVQNISLTRLARSRRVLYVEGSDDFSVITQFARITGLFELADGTEITAVTTGGFSNWTRIRDVAWGINEALGTPLKISVVLDRDYRCDEEVEAVKAELLRNVEAVHICCLKEIENYLLNPTAIHRAVSRYVTDQQRSAVCPSYDDVRTILDSVAEALKTTAQSQYIAKRVAYFRKSHRDEATVTAQAMRIFDEKWGSPDARLGLVPGKEALRMLRANIQERYGVTLSNRRIIGAFRKSDIHLDILQILQMLEEFRTAKSD